MSTDAVSLKLPSLWTNDVETWFAQAEAQFALRDITNETTKFHHVSVLSADVACKVSSILRSPPGHNPYTALNKQLTCKYQLTEHYRALLEAIPVPPRRFTHVHVDIVGPLPTSRGYTYLRTILDRTTRWPEAVPLQDITAAGCARAFMTGWVARFGVPYSMCSLAVSTQDSPAVEPRSNPGSGKILMSENLRLYTTSPLSSCHVLIDKVLSSD